jgi:hypothetical protein
MTRLLERVVAYGRMIRFSHSVFALPFALTSAALAAREGGVSPRRPLDRRGDGVGAQRHCDKTASSTTRSREEPAHGRPRAPEDRLARRGGSFVAVSAAGLVLAACSARSA